MDDSEPTPITIVLFSMRRYPLWPLLLSLLLIAVSPAAGADQPGRAHAADADYLLALSWQPAFCETHRNKQECRSQQVGRYDASHLSLHGLWPQPKSKVYCGVSKKLRKRDKRGRWQGLPRLQLSTATRETLERVMPGSASFLHRHEWIKHGSCYGTAERYFKDSMALLKAINRSLVGRLFREKIGDRLSLDQLRQAFDRAFGAGSGRRVVMKCRKGMITELRIALRGDPSAGSLAELIQAAPVSNGKSCRKGRVDAAGFSSGAGMDAAHRR
ncbi:MULTISPECIES: ribonuclease T2 family protein [sulfur-oxidizing symbionts]|nr:MULTISPECIES: ribonuclease T2 [sulfur-oxidizing symbionts]EGV50929.1 putative ribonuclease T2-family protein [endosymbiont of Riftia pachyptila (vent Ph05)]